MRSHLPSCRADEIRIQAAVSWAKETPQIVLRHQVWTDSTFTGPGRGAQGQGYPSQSLGREQN